MSAPTSGPARLGWFVKERRVNLRLSQAAAAKLAGISRPAWMNIESGGGNAYDTTYRGVEEALAWVPGSCATVLGGGEPVEVAARPLTRAERARALIEFAQSDPTFTSEPTLARVLIEKAEAVLREEESGSTNSEAG